MQISFLPVLVAAAGALTACSTATPGSPTAAASSSGATVSVSASASSTTASVGPAPTPTGQSQRAAAPPTTVRATSGSVPTSLPSIAGPGPSAGCPVPANRVLQSAPGVGKTVALTFDDGASSVMPQAATILKANGVNAATFFDTGLHDAAFRSAVRQVSAMGFLIEDHTWDHLYPSQVPGGWTLSYLRDQIASTARQQRQFTGRPSCLFRPPGGFTANVMAAARDEGMSVALWSVDTLDWQQPGHYDPAYVDLIVHRATTLTTNISHPVVLMHVGKASHEPDSQVSPYRGNTLAALPAIINWYRAHGYRFVDLLGGT